MTHGLAVIPLKTDGTKAALVRWGDGRIYQWEEIAHWFNRDYPCGIGLICGRRSGGLESLDFDTHHSPSVYPRWADSIASELLAKLVITATPSGGITCDYRTETPTGSTALARHEARADGKLPHATIELLGEGHYVVAFGSPAYMHKANEPYRLIRNDPSDPPLLSNEERAELHEAARALNLYHADTKPPKKKIDRKALRGRRLPGDKFNATASWEEVLEPHGWTIAATKGDTTHWTRPDGTRGRTHATTGYKGVDVCKFFTDCPPSLDPNKSHSKFAVWTALQFGGDWGAAVAALKAKHLQQ